MRYCGPFWTKVKKGAPDECWPWLGYVGPSGHGMTQHEYVSMYASRKAWIVTHGRIKEGKCVLHKCDNALCCNPAHLYLGTRADNMADLWGKTPASERKMGRTSMFTEEQIEELYRLRADGYTLKACAEKFNCHLQTVRRVVLKRRQEKLARNRSAKLAGVIA